MYSVVTIMKMDLFGDTAAILNSIVLNSCYGIGWGGRGRVANTYLICPLSGEHNTIPIWNNIIQNGRKRFIQAERKSTYWLAWIFGPDGSSALANLNITQAGAHYWEPATPIISQCNRIFTNQSSFRYFSREIVQFQCTWARFGEDKTMRPHVNIPLSCRHVNISPCL